RTVLAVPGTSSKSTCPPERSAERTSRISSLLPWTTVSMLSSSRLTMSALPFAPATTAPLFDALDYALRAVIVPASRSARGCRWRRAARARLAGGRPRADTRDRRVEDDVRVADGQLPGLGERGDLVVLDELDRRDAGLPFDDQLVPERVVVGFTGLRPEDSQLPRGCPAGHEVLRRRPLCALEDRGEVDVPRRRLCLARDVGDHVAVLVTVVVALVELESRLRRRAEQERRCRLRGSGEECRSDEHAACRDLDRHAFPPFA